MPATKAKKGVPAPWPQRQRNILTRTETLSPSPGSFSMASRQTSTDRYPPSRKSTARRDLHFDSLALRAPAQEIQLNKNIRAFIVDDYTTMLRILRNLLRQLDIHNVEEANDGEAAFHMIQKSQPDLIISDWNMTPMTGLELLRKVRADAKLRHIPFIMVTAESKTENVVTAKQSGVSNYIVKPFNAETLRAKIASVMPV
jgi:two-component system chemotaxis response regulator CheY